MRRIIKRLVALSIESSCDDTCYTSVYKYSKKLLFRNFSLKHSSFLNFFGGVFPRLSSVCHGKTYSKANINLGTKLIALTAGPGIKECLFSGRNYAGLGRNKDRIKQVNHLHSHLIVSLPAGFFSYPFLGLVLSGGHTLIVLCLRPGNYVTLGQSYDDSVGDCYEKVLRGIFPNKLGSNFHELIHECYEKWNKSTNALSFDKPIKMNESSSLNFSFCGMKTFYLGKMGLVGPENIAIALLNHINEIILINIIRSLLILRETMYFPKCLVFGGGFTSNNIFRNLCHKYLNCLNIKFYFPNQKYSVDNSFMIFKSSTYDIKYKLGLDSIKGPKEVWGLNELKCDE